MGFHKIDLPHRILPVHLSAAPWPQHRSGERTGDVPLSSATGHANTKQADVYIYIYIHIYIMYIHDQADQADQAGLGGDSGS
jgi:hypothetical protein